MNVENLTRYQTLSTSLLTPHLLHFASRDVPLSGTGVTNVNGGEWRSDSSFARFASSRGCKAGQKYASGDPGPSMRHSDMGR